MQEEIVKKLAATAAIALGFVALGAPAASAGAPGKDAQTCFGAAYGQTGLQYGQLKKNAPHPVDGGYGLPGVLAAHGPNGAIPLCS
jgi:hypothetical protein